MRSLALILLAATLAGCGYVGDPLPPALNMVQRITDLRALEYGDRLVIAFTIPELTTEQLPVKNIREVDLRIGPAPSPFDAGRWAEGARKIAVSAAKPGAVQAAAPAREWVGRSVVIAARVVNAKGRASEWSNLAVVAVLEPVAVPRELKVAPDLGGVKLTWSGTRDRVRVFRRPAAPDEKPALLDTVEGSSYLDRTAEYGKPYEYTVQAVEQSAESEISVPFAITPVDVTPPAVPAGLTAVPGIGSVELVWDRNTEADLRGYRVYRSVEGGAFERLAEFVDTPAYSDRQVEAGKKYRYAVTAIDTSGNESARSQAVEVSAP